MPVKAYPAPVVDVAARQNRRRQRHVTLSCEQCGRRIAWTTRQQVRRYAAGEVKTAWLWQGAQPIVERPDRKGSGVVDLRCFHCGWERTVPVEQLGRSA